MYKGNLSFQRGKLPPTNSFRIPKDSVKPGKKISKLKKLIANLMFYCSADFRKWITVL